MARERHGWEWVNGASRWAPTVEIQMAGMLDGKYGSERDEARRELEDLVRAAQRDAAEEIRKALRKPHSGGDWFDGMQDASDLAFPEYPKESDSE
ncbi:hypothetical protein [Streptomyces olivaceus]|uniref:hypothetical protein n=1 Tax=Streptomyces olivaceus TaxID=47716 RepID=UPI0036EB9A42